MHLDLLILAIDLEDSVVDWISAIPARFLKAFSPSLRLDTASSRLDLPVSVTKEQSILFGPIIFFITIHSMF